MRTPSPPPHARLSSSSSLPGTEVVMQPRPDHLRLTPPSSVGRAHVFYLAHAATPSPPSLFSCDISDSVTPPPPQPQQIPQAFSLLSPKKKKTRNIASGKQSQAQENNPAPLEPLCPSSVSCVSGSVTGSLATPASELPRCPPRPINWTLPSTCTRSRRLRL